MTDHHSPMRVAIAAAHTMLEAALANPKPASTALYNAWELAFTAAGLAPEDVTKAAGIALLRTKFFPTPSEIVEFALAGDGGMEARAEHAWQTVFRLVRTVHSSGSLDLQDVEGDGCCLAAIARMGWQRICEKLHQDNVLLWRSEFVKTYTDCVRTNEEVSRVAGMCERENAGRFDLTDPTLIGRPDRLGPPRLKPALPEPKMTDEEIQAALAVGKALVAGAGSAR